MRSLVIVIALTGVARADDSACTTKDVSTNSRVERMRARIGKARCSLAADTAENCAQVKGITVTAGADLVGTAREVCREDLSKDDVAMLATLSKRCEDKFAGSSTKRAPLAEALCKLEVAALLWRIEQPGDEAD